jgi:hypothetical protein
MQDFAPANSYAKKSALASCLFPLECLKNPEKSCSA